MGDLKASALPMVGGKRLRVFEINRGFVAHNYFSALELRAGMDLQTAAASLGMSVEKIKELGIITEGKLRVETLWSKLYAAGSKLDSLLKEWGVQLRAGEVYEMPHALRFHVIDVFVARLTDETKALIVRPELLEEELRTALDLPKKIINPEIGVESMNEETFIRYLLDIKSKGRPHIGLVIDLVYHYKQVHRLNYERTEALAYHVADNLRLASKLSTSDQVEFLSAFIADY